MATGKKGGANSIPPFEKRKQEVEKVAANPDIFHTLRYELSSKPWRTGALVPWRLSLSGAPWSHQVPRTSS
jgi:hypothetical protein